MRANFDRNHIVRIHLSFLVGGFILLYWESLKYWVHTWLTDFNYHSGFIMPLLCFYIVWTKRDLLAHTPIKPSKSGLLVIIVGMLFYIGGQAAYTKTAQQFSFFILIPGIILHYFGFRVLRRLSVALVVLVFMTPYAELFYSHIQQFITWACAEILLLFDVPAYVESTYIQLPNLCVQIAPGCTGIRFMTAIFPLGLTIAYLHFNSWRKKILVLLVSAVLPIVANMLRIVIMLTVALHGNPIFVTGTAHIVYGYSVFLVALLILFAFVGLLKPCRAAQFSKPKEIAKREKFSDQHWAEGFASYSNLILIALIVLIPALVHARLAAQHATPLKRSFKLFPVVLGEWEGRQIAEDEWHPEIIGATDNLRRLYEDPDGNQIRAFVSYLPIQTQGRELVFRGNRVLPPGFMTISQKAKAWTIGNLSRSELKTKFVQSGRGTQSETLLYWYQNTNRFVHNEFMAKAFMAMDSLLRNRSNGSAFVLMFTSTSFNGDDQETKIQDFLSVFMNEILKYLPS
jgi:EpsI family protein